MQKLSLPILELLRDNLSVLMTFAYSRPALRSLTRGPELGGELKIIEETVLSFAQQRAERACLELAILLRYFDDEEGLSNYFDKSPESSFGDLVLPDGTTGELDLRDVANKIVHAVSFEWDCRDPKWPSLICHSRETEKWLRARIDIVALAAVLGNLPV